MRDLQNLLPFVQAARCGSFAAAAAYLQVTPPAVSKNIALLEAELGVRLFNRTTRRISLTAEGQAFYEQVAKLLEGVDEAVRIVSSANREPRGLVRVSVTASFGRHCLLPLVAEFHASYPEIELEFSLDETPPSLVEGGFDVRIQHAQSRETSHVLRLLCEYPIILVAHPDYLSRRGSPQSPAELAEHDCISVRLAAGKAPWHLAHAPGGQLPVTAAEAFVHHPAGPVTVATQLDGSLIACLHGGGITPSSVPITLPYLKSAALKLVLPEYRVFGSQGMHSKVFIQFPHREHLSAKVRVFVDYLIAHFHGQDYAALDLSAYIA